MPPKTRRRGRRQQTQEEPVEEDDTKKGDTTHTSPPAGSAKEETRPSRRRGRGGTKKKAAAKETPASLEESSDTETATSDDGSIEPNKSTPAESAMARHNQTPAGKHAKSSDENGTANSKTTDTTPETTSKPQANWWRRFWTTWAMIGAFFLLIYKLKQLGIILLVLLVQANIYRELVLLAIKHNKERQLPGFNFFYYYWFAVFVFFIYCRSLMPHFQIHDLEAASPSLWWILKNYVPVSFALYTLGFVGFVVSLRKKKLYRYQFSQFAYCHMALFMVVWQSTFLAANVFQGMIWMVLPATLVICNDIFAYVFGRLFGRTPLIRLSPKKTWEGFIGAFIATIVWAFAFTRVLETATTWHTNELMLCPKTGFNPFDDVSCDTGTIHGGIHVYYPLQEWWFGTLIPRIIAHWEISEMQLHSIVMAVFASLVAPFGGFFASGFKRAFKIKDFGESIPGHGGFTDRMDCQIVMGSFAYIYCWHLLKLSDQVEPVARATLQYLLKRSMQLTTEQKEELVLELQRSLSNSGN